MTEQLRNVDEHRVSTGDDQSDVGRIGRTVLQEVRPVVTFQVIDADQRYANRERDRLRGGHADEERADQSGTDRDGHAVEIAETVSGSLERVRQERVERLDVRARRDLGDDPTESFVEVLLTRD